MRPLRTAVKFCERCKSSIQLARQSRAQFESRRFCSPQCAGQARRILDGMTKGERYRRKNGQLRLGSAECRAKVAAATAAAMHRPDVQEKIHRPRAPQGAAERQKRSDALCGKRPANFVGGKRSNPGWIEIGGKRHYMMSMWERNVCRYLQWLVDRGDIVSWEYESQVFLFEQIVSGNRSYRPDFKVTENDGTWWWLEVKGWMDPASKTKLNRMRRYFPSERVEVFGRDRYYRLAKQVSGIIVGWETASKAWAP